MKEIIYIQDAKTFLEKGWYFRAALELGKHIHSSGDLIAASVISPFLNLVDWKKVEIESKNQIKKGSNILSFGSVWDEDEILLVFSIMLNIFLIEEVSNFLNLGLVLKISNLKELLKKESLKSIENQKSINSAAKMLDRNSKIKNWRKILEFEQLFV